MSLTCNALEDGVCAVRQGSAAVVSGADQLCQLQYQQLPLLLDAGQRAAIQLTGHTQVCKRLVRQPVTAQHSTA